MRITRTFLLSSRYVITWQLLADRLAYAATFPPGTPHRGDEQHVRHR